MSKVLIDRELLSVASLHLEYSGYTETGKKLRALLDTPSGTPAMPVKAYYHEAPNEYGGLNKSVGLEVRTTFIDAPLVLESDALARIACLEGEIAKRDEELAACRIAVENCDLFRARVVELESQYQRDVYGLNDEGDPIGGDPAGGYANDNARLRSELAAIKAQEPVAWKVTNQITGDELLCNYKPGGLNYVYHPLYAAPVSEAKAQGVVQWPNADEIMQMAFEEGQPADDASGYCFELEEFDLFIERLMSEVARLNAAPVQQSEYGDAYQGAREDLAVWKRRALEAEEKVLQQEQIIDHLTSEAQGESRFGEPVVTPDAPCVPDGYVLADKKALGTVLQALVNAPHHIRELQVTRQPVELFSDNPINVLIANYEAPAAPAAPAADAGHVFYGMDGNHP